MVQALRQSVTFDEFIEWYPENSTVRYELHDGVIVEMPNATGDHSEVAGFLIAELNFEIRRANVPYFIPKECVVSALDARSGYIPDGIILKREAIVEEPRWKKESILTKGSSIQLIIEVVSTNWQDDYLTKSRDYEALGIYEYWIVDYVGLGGRRFIGNPKQPTLSVCEWMDGEYEVRQFRGSDRIISPTFPDLMLTAEQAFRSGI